MSSHFIDEKCLAFTNEWFKRIWQEGCQLTEFYHHEAFIFGPNRVGMNLESYQQYRDMLTEFVVFERNEVVAATCQGASMQSIGNTYVLIKSTGERVVVAGAMYVHFDNGKLIASVGFLDHMAIVNAIDPVKDSLLMELFNPT